MTNTRVDEIYIFELNHLISIQNIVDIDIYYILRLKTATKMCTGLVEYTFISNGYILAVLASWSKR